MKEFTGERVIPGEVDPDLWNEHLARYAFAARLASWKRVLEIACGTGYGTSYLAPETRSIIGLDLSHEATLYATSHFSAENLRYLTASAAALPFPNHSFDLVIAYEVIEHLSDWNLLLTEAHRVLRPGGQLVLSTPNKDYYADSRKQSGPNPYHLHEFTYSEFRNALEAVFPHVSLFLQNHADGIVFHPITPSAAASIHLETSTADPATAHFFLAVCANAPQTGAPAFVYLPTAANVLRERELHIERLEGELALKDSWLSRTKAEHEKMVALFREQNDALEASNRWSAKVKAELQATGEVLEAKQAELAALHQEGQRMAAGYEEAIALLKQDNAEKVSWATRTEEHLAAKSIELSHSVDLLHEAERTIEERTTWARNLDREIAELRDELARIHHSRWTRLGRILRLAPGVGKQ
ncbi:MAG: methyltransferase domain-containing protein [Bryobacterales bacterium]|nr:methyltransferase domain-containing protein [Bryobacterales bacterium]